MVLLKGVFPVYLQDKTAIILISTPTTSKTFFMRCIAIKHEDTGKPLLQSIRIGEPCDACKKTRTPQNCTHNLDEMPPWKSKSKTSELELLMSGYQDIFLQENFGMTIDSTTRLFPERQLDIIRDAAPFDFPRTPDCVYLAFDPASGGECEYGVCAAVFFGPVMVVCFIYLFIYLFICFYCDMDRFLVDCRVFWTRSLVWVWLLVCIV
jgi:hypothetical protein